MHDDSEVAGCDNVTFTNIAESEPVFGQQGTCF